MKSLLPLLYTLVLLSSFGATNSIASTSSSDSSVAYRFASVGVSDSNLGIEEILASPSLFAFQPLERAYSYSRGNAATWLRFTLLDVPDEQLAALQFYYPGEYELFYQSTSTGWQGKPFGRSVSPRNWDQSDLRSTVVLSSDMDLTQDFYVKISQQGIQPIGHRLTTLWELKQQNKLEGFFWGGIIGLLSIAMFLGALFFLISKGRVYLYFAGISASSIAWTVIFLQIAQYLNSNLYEQNTLNTVFNTIIASLGFCIIQFMRYFVDFRRISPKFDHYFGYTAKGYVLSYLAVVLGEALSPDTLWPMHVFSLLIFISGLMAVVGLILGVIRKDRSSIILALAWIPGSSVAIISVPTYYGLLPGNWWTENIVILGLATAVLMFTVAIADQVLQLRQQNSRLLKARNQELIKKVDEQTAHLVTKSEEIEQQRLQLATTLSYKEDLLANIAHELKTPLTLILGVLGGQYNEDDRKKTLNRLVFRISHLLDNMLDLSKKQEQSTKRDSVHSYRAHEYIDFYLTTYRGFVSDGRINLTENAHAAVLCRPETLDKIITNLINNAIKYSPDETAIHLRAWTDQEAWFLCIENEGKGIAEDSLDTVFERYVQVGEANQSYGLGLGLPLVKQLIESSGGTIQIQSIPNELTSVVVSLPLSTDHDLASEAAKGVDQDDIPEDYRNWLYAELGDHQQNSSSLPHNLSNDTDQPVVYCIDDNTELLNQLEQQLGSHYQIRCFSDPIVAIDQARSEIPDLIVSDVMMPQLSGFDVLNKVREDELLSHIPLILLTARSDEQSRAKGLIFMADDYIEKPYDLQYLTLKIENLLSIRGLLKNKFSVAVETSSTSENSEPMKISVIIEGCQIDQKPFIEKVIGCLQENVGNADFNISELGETLHLSESQVRRKVKAITGYSPQEILKMLRLESAADLIKNGVSLKATAHDCGFSSQSHMGAAFKLYFGKTPNQYRKDI